MSFIIFEFERSRDGFTEYISKQTIKGLVKINGY